MVNAREVIWLVPLLPFLGALLAITLPLPRRAISILCPGAVLLALLVSMAAAWNLRGVPHRSFELVLGVWLPLLHADWGLLLDPLGSIMILVVTGIAFLVHVYSVGYMPHDQSYARYFALLNLFVSAMLILVLANNFVLLFIGWEGVGLCSYLLIGFDYQRHAAVRAGMKAFIVNRIGDAILLMGILLAFAHSGSVRFADVQGSPMIAMLLFFGAAGKSAQVPLHVWLPDAMEGPTPVSALIHAATMVTAGVYLIARSHNIFAGSGMALTVVASVGAFTAIFAATIALVMTDIKRVLAYSTISQLGFMFLALGVGAWQVAIFHLVTHAFFKAVLFLGAGSVIHALGGEQDLRKMGGLRRRLRLTYACMFVGAVALSGIPGLAGFFSKDAILAQTFQAGYQVLYFVGLITTALTALYMWRMMHLAFYTNYRGRATHIHEGGLAMRVPLVGLAVASALAGWIGVPEHWHLPSVFHAFPRWLAPMAGVSARTVATNANLEWILSGIAVAAALIGIALARYFYHRRPELPATLEQALKPLHGVLSEKWFIDELYQAVFVDGLMKGGGHWLGRFDTQVLDGGVNLAGSLTRQASRVSIFWDTWVVDGAVRLTGISLGLASYPARLWQTGRVQSYALAMVFGMIVFFGFYLLAR